MITQHTQMHADAMSSGLGRSLANALADARAPLLFGVRLWASVCLALFVAFWLQLDSPFWAGTSAAVVCQPQLGASLRKGWFRMIGTVIGAVVIVVLTACFPQDRIGFFRAAGPVGRNLRVRRHGAAQLRILRGVPRRLHGRDRRCRHARGDRRREFGGLPAGDLTVPARSASASCVPASSSPGPILAAPRGGSQRHWPIWRPISRADLPACWHWRGRSCRTRKPSDANFCAASSSSTR